MNKICRKFPNVYEIYNDTNCILQAAISQNKRIKLSDNVYRIDFMYRCTQGSKGVLALFNFILEPPVGNI